MVKKRLPATLAGVVLGATLFGSTVSAATPEQNAKSLGQNLTVELNDFNKLIDSGSIKEIHLAYDSLSQQIKNTEKAIGKISGKTNRNNLNEKYVRPAKIARERVIYEVSQFRLLESIDEKLSSSAEANVSSDLAKLERLKKRAVEIKKAGGYKSLIYTIPESLKDWELDIRAHKNPEKENQVIDIESEPNDTVESANKALSGVVYKGYVSTSEYYDEYDKEDTYVINVLEPGKVRIVLLGNALVNVYDEMGRHVTVGSGAIEFEASTTDKYYIHGNAEQVYSTLEKEAYHLKVTYPTSNSHDSDDIMSNANHAKSGRTYFATIDTWYDLDLYRIELESPGTIYAKLGFNYDNKKLYIFDKYGNVLKETYSLWAPETTIGYEATYSGIYFIGVEEDGEYSATNPYSLFVRYPANISYN